MAPSRVEKVLFDRERSSRRCGGASLGYVMTEKAYDLLQVGHTLALTSIKTEGQYAMSRQSLVQMTSRWRDYQTRSVDTALYTICSLIRDTKRKSESFVQIHDKLQNNIRS